MQMEDRERGLRIKDLRKAKAERLGKRVTQPQMAEAVGVSLRAAQEWEYGGGIDDEHLPGLVDFLETTADYLLRGRGERGGTPDLLSDLDSDLHPYAEQLDRIERKVDRIIKELGAEPDESLPPDALPDEQDPQQDDQAEDGPPNEQAG